MNTTLIVLDDDNKWQQLDLYEELSINVIIQETDITDIEARRSPYSKIFAIPGTKNNNAFFESFYEVNGTSFDPLTRRECVVQYRGTDIFKGFLRLNKVTILDNTFEYEVYILSEITDFATLIQDTQLNELDWNYLNHIQNFDTVKMSWYADGSDTAGLFGGKIIYPMAHYGLIYSGATGDTAQFKFGINLPDNKGLNYSGTSIPPTYFKPAIRILEVLNKIFESTGYEVVSNFFKTDYFRSIYMDLAANGKIGVETVEDKSNQNIFKVYGPPEPAGQKLLYSNGVFHQLNMDRIDETDGYDPSGNYDETFWCFQAPVSGYYSFEFTGTINQITNTNTVGTYYGFNLFASSTREGLSNSGTRTPVGGTIDNYIALNYSSQNRKRVFFNNVLLTAGQFVGLFIRFNTSSSSNRNAGLWVLPRNNNEFGARWELYNSPQYIVSNNVDMKLQFPELSALDFFKSIIKMFNLVVVQTPDEKKLRIEPLPWYYAQTLSNEVDWTQKIDKNSPIVVEPVNFQLQKEYNFQYASAEDEHLGKLWEDIYQVPYGTKKFVAKSDILTGKSVLEFPFRPVPTEVITGSTNIIIPMFYRFDEATFREVPYSNKNHIFFWCGNRFFYNDYLKTEQMTWRMTSGATPVDFTTYPCISHLSTLDDNTEFSDLNFDKNFDFFGDDNTAIQQFTQYNLYQLWYGDYFNNLYSPEVRRMSAKILLNPLDVYNINLTDRVFIKDAIYNIEKVNEADLVNWKLTDVSFIKQVSQYNKIDPPAPVYDVMVNEPYGATGATYTFSGWVADFQSDVCNELVTSGTVYSTFSAATSGAYIFSDSGATQPYPIGTYFKEISGDTYVVINSLGLITEDPC